jgi:hypothetical protein
VQLDLSVQAEGRSLQKAIADAARVISAIETIAKRYCLEAGLPKKECEEAVEASQY